MKSQSAMYRPKYDEPPTTRASKQLVEPVRDSPPGRNENVGEEIQSDGDILSDISGPDFNELFRLVACAPVP